MRHYLGADRATIHRLGAAIPVALLALLALLGAGCAFSLGDDTSGETGGCETNADCGNYKACDISSKMCIMQAPEPQKFRLTGPFEVDLKNAVLGGVALSASWDEFTDSGVTVPAMSVIITYSTLSSLDSSKSVLTDELDIYFVGARHMEPDIARSFPRDPTLRGMLFVYAGMYIPISQIAAGTHQVTPDLGALEICPAYPAPVDGSFDFFNPWQAVAQLLAGGGPESHQCWQFFEIHEGSITYDEVSLDAENGKVVGSMDLKLVPKVIKPTYFQP